MRWFFFLLVLVNIGYVAWELNREHPQPAVKSQPKGVETIVLLSELRAEPAKKQADEQVVAVDAVAQVASPESDADSEPLPLAEADKPDVQTALLKPVAEPGGADEPEDAELPGAEKPAKPTVTTRPEPAGDRCYTLGPFSEMKTLRLVTREIKDYVVEASFRSKEEQEQTRFRVLIRPVGSKQAANALIKKLNSKNIRDHFILTEGPNKNAISLGYFSSKGRAYRYADRVRKLGFDAVAEPVFRRYTIYWLDYRIKAGNEVPQQIFNENLKNSAQRLSRACG